MRSKLQKYALALVASAITIGAVNLSLSTIPAAHADTSSLSSTDLINIASSGGSMQFDASRFSSVDLINIASAAASSSSQPVQLTMLNVNKLSSVDLINIASSGKGHVTFILDR